MTDTGLSIQEYATGWQEIVNLLADIIDVPAALIMHLTDNGELKVYLASQTENNPYKVGEKDIMENSGLYCERVIKTGKHLKVPNALADVEWMNNPDVERNMISYLGFPICYPSGKPFGTLCVLDSKENHYSKKYEDLLNKFRQTIQDELKLIDLNRTLKTLSDTDPLTGIFNRRVFFDKLEVEIYKAERYKTPLSLIMFDFNKFKELNDNAGHIAGDEALREYVSITKKIIRPSDIFCRYGGDEFLIALPETNERQAEKLAGRIKRNVEAGKVHTAGSAIPFSVTAGASEYRSGDTVEDLIKRTDIELYHNKLK